MRSRKPFIIFWPAYFDLKRSRAEGRRIPKKYAIERINTQDIVKAAKKLGYDTQFEGGYKYPKTWWDDPGRVLIDIKGKQKSKVMLEIAKEIRKMQTKN
ncbi:MAG: signal recognition particle subunit SRP19/SEC65 family protein [Promethearchaeota archaeon]